MAGRPATRRPPNPHTDLLLMHGDAAVEQIAAVGIAVAQGDAEETGRRQRAIYGDDRERYRQAIIRAQSRDRDGMRHVVIGHRIDLRGVEISSRTWITEVLFFRLLIAIVLMHVEVGFATLTAGLVAIPVCRVASSTATAAAAAACPWNKVISAHDVDQIKELAADRAVED